LSLLIYATNIVMYFLFPLHLTLAHQALYPMLSSIIMLPLL